MNDDDCCFVCVLKLISNCDSIISCAWDAFLPIPIVDWSKHLTK